MAATNETVKSVSLHTLVLQAAGISTGEDVIRAIRSGADGTGGTSGIVAKPDPCAALEEMLTALHQIKEEESEKAWQFIRIPSWYDPMDRVRLIIM